MKNFIRQCLISFVRLILNLFGQGWRNRLGGILRQAMAEGDFDGKTKMIKTARGDISFYCLGDLPLWRAETLLTKEPETIEWIDRMDEGDVLYDIGANIGAYTLYAGISKKNKVIAFEPLASNYFLINQNIERNNLSANVRAYCLALNDTNMISSFHVSDSAFGSALSSFHEPVDQFGHEYIASFEQAMMGITLDSFIENFNPDFPNYIKIDVDGIEDKVIKGALKTIKDPRLKSISIELDRNRAEYTGEIIKCIEDVGFKLVDYCPDPNLENAHILNYQFFRQDNL